MADADVVWRTESRQEIRKRGNGSIIEAEIESVIIFSRVRVNFESSSPTKLTLAKAIRSGGALRP